MTKKEYITIFLDKVKDIREPARGFLVLIRYNVFNDDQVDELFSVFKNVVKTTSEDLNKRKIQRGIEMVEQIKAKERSSETLSQDLDQILSEI